MSQKEMARFYGVHENTITNWKKSTDGRQLIFKALKKYYEETKGVKDGSSEKK